MYKCRAVTEEKEVIKMYKAFIQPYFLYGIEVWGHSVKSEKYILLRLQSKVLRIIFDCKRSGDAWIHNNYQIDNTEDEVGQIIKELENSKSSDFPIRVIKKLSHILTPVLTAHFNRAMMEGTFPSILKLGKITPVYKKDDEQLLENYRPISTLPIFGKIFEKIIYTRLYGFFTSNNILNKSQFGFRKSHSTSHALNYIY